MYILLSGSKLSELKYHFKIPIVTCKFQVMFSIMFTDTVYHEIGRYQRLQANKSIFYNNIQFPGDKSFYFFPKSKTEVV